MPTSRAKTEARIERLSPASARIAPGDESEVVHLGSDATCQAVAEPGLRDHRAAQGPHGSLRSQVEFKPVPPDLDRGGG